MRKSLLVIQLLIMTVISVWGQSSAKNRKSIKTVPDTLPQQEVSTNVTVSHNPIEELRSINDSLSTALKNTKNINTTLQKQHNLDTTTINNLNRLLSISLEESAKRYKTIDHLTKNVPRYHKDSIRLISLQLSNTQFKVDSIKSALNLKRKDKSLDSMRNEYQKIKTENIILNTDKVTLLEKINLLDSKIDGLRAEEVSLQKETYKLDAENKKLNLKLFGNLETEIRNVTTGLVLDQSKDFSSLRKKLSGLSIDCQELAGSMPAEGSLSTLCQQVNEHITLIKILGAASDALDKPYDKVQVDLIVNDLSQQKKIQWSDEIDMAIDNYIDLLGLYCKKTNETARYVNDATNASKPNIKDWDNASRKLSIALDNLGKSDFPYLMEVCKGMLISVRSKKEISGKINTSASCN